jgi:hypothetical protein
MTCKLADGLEASAAASLPTDGKASCSSRHPVVVQWEDLQTSDGKAAATVMAAIEQVRRRHRRHYVCACCLVF